MSYTKRQDIPVKPGETVVELDSGQAVAVACTAARDHVSNDLVFEVTARWVDEAGVTRLDSSGREVQTTYSHRSTASEVDALTTPTITKECLLLVLGESLTENPDHPEVTIIPWSSELVTQCSIRNAIASAQAVAPAAADVL